MSPDWIDFKKLKATVSMEMVLAHYGVKLRRVNPAYFRGMCPLPAHTSKSANTFAVNTEKNVWACQSQSCVAARRGKKGGNVLDFIGLMENCSIRDAAIKLTNWFHVSSGGPAPPGNTRLESDASKQLVAKVEADGEVTNDIRTDAQNKPLGFALRNIDHLHPYLTARGITAETAQHFGIGFFSGRGSMSGRVVIPIHNWHGEIVAYAGRSIDNSEPRYKLPNSFHKCRELFNLHRVRALGSDLVIVVEGFFGTAKVHQAGYPSVVALMGSALSQEQEETLAEFARVVLLLDGDVAGKEATNAIAFRLMCRTFVKTIHLPEESQPDQLSPEDLKFILGSL